MKEKTLIILGGNSKLVTKLLEHNLFNLYKKIIIISHRKYNGKLDFDIIEFLDPKLLEKTLENIISSEQFEFDLIISNTPPQNSDFKNSNILEWSMATLKIMKKNSLNKKFRKLIYTGSCLPLLPFYHDGFYKKLKNNEMTTFIKLDLKLNKNQTYIILPPLKFKSDKKINLIFDNYEKWALILKEELGFNNSIVFPRGIVGIITKILFFIKFRIL